MDTALFLDIPIDNPFSEYNQALAAAKLGKYTDAHARLERLSQSDIYSGYVDKVYELYGDVLYLSSGAHDDIKKLYLLAYTAHPSDRLTKKIALLDVYPTSSTGQIQTGSTVQSLSSDITASGKLSLDASLQTLEKDDAEKGKYLYPPNGTPRPENQRLSDIRQFLDEGVEKIDW